jgi:mannose-6-phosphate isomerase-like protein (cupin superfamily)
MRVCFVKAGLSLGLFASSFWILGQTAAPDPAPVRYPQVSDAADRQIDLFVSDWQGSMPRHAHGSIVLRDILTKGDNFAPPQRGATLSNANALSYARLAAGNWTTSSRLEGQQEILYIVSGEGEIAAGGTMAPLRKGVAVLIPAGIEFVVKAAAAQPLMMYVLNEPTPYGFTPRKTMLVREVSSIAAGKSVGPDSYLSTGSARVQEIFTSADGLAMEQTVAFVTLPPQTMTTPHPRRPGQEEIWVAVDGVSRVLMGTELRVLQPGMAWMPRPDGSTSHAVANKEDKPATFLYFSHFPEPAKPAAASH